MYATDVRQTDVRQHHRLMLPGRGHHEQYAATCRSIVILMSRLARSATSTAHCPAALHCSVLYCMRSTDDFACRKAADAPATQVLPCSTDFVKIVFTVNSRITRPKAVMLNDVKTPRPRHRTTWRGQGRGQTFGLEASLVSLQSYRFLRRPK